MIDGIWKSEEYLSEENRSGGGSESVTERICLPHILGVAVLFIDSQFTVVKLLECLEHNLIRSLSPKSHCL
jgi:hypothetical protein